MQTERPHPFAVGRIGPNGDRVVVLGPPVAAPIPGPWQLKAITTAPRTKQAAARPRR